ncbi:unnamed protein product [Oncorhynchus mykiss]|uniref:Insulin receptor substrate 2-B-like n=1 Tax=Oncorhynchus mykiss TaxID=8022 RepID=A0A060XMB4_ONCMY|nr:unnamed protein product [Oncorhynchus mykiss]
MLLVETQQRGIGTTPAATAANGYTSIGEPPSPLLSICARFHQHMPPSNHHSHHHYPQSSLPKEQRPLLHHYPAATQQQLHTLSGENIPGSPVRKASLSSLNLVHEDPSASHHALAASVNAASAAIQLAANANVSVSTSGVMDDIRKCGYLRKQKHGHKRFFVLRVASHLGLSRLEYYDSDKKFRSSLRSSAAAPKRVIYLYQCFTVNKRADSKNKHLIALYTKDEYFAIVAENEQEQEDWYVALSELMSEGKKGHLDSDELDDGYGTVTPGTVFKEVWQVNVKPKGLGQTKNLTGVYRLCLSSKTIHLVKLNSETPYVNLQLMNIRRCGHSESFFFIEVGRSSSIGPGEIWMQVDDSVVAQNMHETILETMKALKAFAEIRPRSKSQSSGSNPMAFITTRRHLGNLPPSQTGLQRRSRTESAVGTPPSSKSSGASGYRFRTSSEGEGTMNRPFRSVTGSLIHLNTARIHLGRQEGRYARALPGSNSHTRSASLPVSHFSSTTSPVSVSSSSGHGSVSDTLTRPSSSSICGSPSDGGFNSSDEYGSSPGDFRYFRVRSNTPDSLGNTPPIREENCLSDYMAMGWHREVTSTDEDRSLRRRTHSFTRPGSQGGVAGGSSCVAVYQKMTQTTFSQDELVSNQPSSTSSSLRSDYSSCSEHSQGRPPPLSSYPSSSAKEDSGYMPMLCGPSHSPQASSPALAPRSAHQLQQHQPTDPQGYMMMLPGGPSSSSPVQASPSPHSSSSNMGLGVGRYYTLSNPEGTPKSYSPYFSLPRSYKAPVARDGEQRKWEHEEYPAAAEGPSSPGEYINIEFGDPYGPLTSCPLSDQYVSPSMGSAEQRHSPPQNQDYMSVVVGGGRDDGCRLTKNQSPRPSLVAPWNPPSYIRPLTANSSLSGSPGSSGAHWRTGTDDYTDMTFNLSKDEGPPSSFIPQPEPPKVVRADPQGRRRHSSETFSSTPGGGRPTSSTTGTNPPSGSANPSAINGALPAEGSKWASSGSFDSVWMCVEGIGSASSGGPPGGHMCRNGSVGYQNGLNYIALELREDQESNTLPIPQQQGGTGPTPNAPSAGNVTVPVAENNGAYASIDFTKSDGMTATFTVTDHTHDSPVAVTPLIHQ